MNQRPRSKGPHGKDRPTKSRLLITALVFTTVAIVFVLVLFRPSGTQDSWGGVPQKEWPVSNPRCNEAVVSLKKINVRLLALDFDQTIIDQHTGGRWKGTSKELAKHVRPEFVCLIGAAMNGGIHIAVATFSEQTDLISDVMQITFPGTTIPVHGGGVENKLRKNPHIEKAIGMAPGLSKAAVLLIDDDFQNVNIAQFDGIRGIHFKDPASSKGDIILDAIISATASR